MNRKIVSVTNGSRVAPEKLAEVEEYLSPHSFAEVQSGLDGNGPSVSLQSSGLIAAELLQNLTGEEVFFQQLTYLMRTGTPDGQDLLGATNFSLTAARLLHAGTYGRMTSFQQRRTWTHVDLSLAAQGEKTVDVDAWYDAGLYKPTDGLIWAAAEV